MKIVHVQIGMGPAGNAAYRLHLAMRRNGLDSSVIVFEKSLQRNNVLCVKKTFYTIFTKVINSLYRKTQLKTVAKDAYFYSNYALFSRLFQNHPLIKEADVIYLHVIDWYYVSQRELQCVLELRKPTVFFMHDMWTFTGGCHHSFDCTEYQRSCEGCKMFISDNRIAKIQLQKKIILYAKFNHIAFVSPSKWMAQCAFQSASLHNKIVQVISNIVDDSIFKPIKKETARDILNLPYNKRIVTFGCVAGTENPFKGWEYLRKAIEMLTRPDIHIVIYGSEYNKETQSQLHYPITFLGPILDEHVLALICCATDVFVSPSLAESFGLTLLENLLCGTPVVGFDNTAISEIIQHKVNGYLARNKDAEDLKNGIEYVLNEHLVFNQRKTFSQEQIIHKHLVLIQQLNQLLGNKS